MSPIFPAPRDATLVLADGSVFRGRAFGARGVQSGEVCFNTSLTGYQEIASDPSYAGQIVAMTASQIGNVGVNDADREAARPFLAGFVVKELSRLESNWRAEGSLARYLANHDVPGIAGLDTRALVRRIRDGGFQTGVLSTDPAAQDAEALVARARSAPSLDGVDWVARVTTAEPYVWKDGEWPGIVGQLPRRSAPEPRLRLVAYDFGIKRNILRLLSDTGFDVTVVPATTPADEALRYEPDGVFLSNGPGDPTAVEGVRETVRALCERLPVFGICLGHQILALSLGGSTRKLKFGHHGGNQPGHDRATGRVAICAENHGYAVDPESLRAAGEAIEVTHVNLNDDTVEGIAHAERPLFSVQYHPEASPGPHDARFFFDRFRSLVERRRRGETVSGLDVARGR